MTSPPESQNMTMIRPLALVFYLSEVIILYILCVEVKAVILNLQQMDLRYISKMAPSSWNPCVEVLLIMINYAGFLLLPCYILFPLSMLDYESFF